ncbi:MAG: hypothetical protein HRT87_03420 [Legionellales bacterium]|nr:hypothetical protein [Legionellales bacterium]
MIIILIIIAGIANAFMDTIAFKNGGRLPKNKWWSMKDSWKNKWKNGDPEQGEAFLGSSTVFVFVTDAWHFFQSIMISCFCVSIAIASYTNYLDHIMVSITMFVACKVFFSAAFEVSWRILNKKK